MTDGIWTEILVLCDNMLFVLEEDFTVVVIGFKAGIVGWPLMESF